ncbi:glycosyltransferase family 2 protein [Tropicimonas marinistellae]|uniref:glycosyltransferase family 2 protein n=1 Tax=Tropicimonas marinistellae TaxID=1739787 RepID=UPI000829A6E6|nr:glycosyltransferase family 2 protein [Tropicimonas marinistellae]
MSYSLPAAEPRSNPSLALVIPCYNEQACIHALFAELEALEYRLLESDRIQGRMEVILIDDGSTDDTWPMIAAPSTHLHVTALRLSRNHGHQRALLAGLLHGESDVVVSLDADLQDDPSVIPQMIDGYLAGADIVYGVRRSRDADTPFKRRSAQLYYATLRRLGVELIPDHADYRLMSRKALRSLAEFGEANLYLRGLIPQLGFQTATVSYDRPEREAGESKYPLRKMISLAIEGVTSTSVAPLRIITVAGFVVALLAFLYILYSVCVWAIGGTVAGWASTVVAIYFLGGAHLVALGVIGEYVGKIYKETKRRPRYILDEVVTSHGASAEQPNSEALKSKTRAA